MKKNDQQIEALGIALELAKTDGMLFSQFVMPEFKAWDHIKKIWDLLHKVESGEVTHAIITMPPQHGKSTSVSCLFPSFFFGRNPTLDVVLASNSIQLAVDFGRDITSILTSNIFKAIFPEVELPSGKIAKGNFMLKNGGKFFAAGVGAGFTGRPADLIILDDTIKTSQQADSPVFLKQLYDFWYSVVETRMRNSTRVILMHTRWRQNDLIGHVLKNYSHHSWEVLSLPAIDEEKNQALCPEIVSLEKLRQRQKSNPRDFSALYQQNPLKKDGNIINTSNLVPYDKDQDLKFDYTIHSWDLTFGDGADSDYNVGTVWGVLREKNNQKRKAYLIDIVREKADFTKQIYLIDDLIQKHGIPSKILIENSANGKASLSVLSAKYKKIELVQVKGSKEDRANSVSYFVNSSLVYVPLIFQLKNLNQFIEELEIFPAGEHDDCVDSFTQSLNYIFKDYNLEKNSVYEAQNIVKFFKG